MDLTGKKFDLVGAMLGSAPSPDRAKTGVKPKPGEATGSQNPLSNMPLVLPGLGFLPGMTGTDSQAFPFGGWGGLFGSPLFPGVPLNIMGAFFGWTSSFGLVQPRKGSYWTYRLMDLNPTLRLVRQLIVAPILTSEWVVKPAEWASDRMPVKDTAQKTARRKQKEAKQPWRANLDPQKLENAVALVSDQVLPVRRPFLTEAVRYLSFGHRSFEKVWDLRSGFYWFQKAKSLLPDWTFILHDGTGSFAGVSQGGIDGGNLGPEKSFIVTNDGESGNLYGLSRHESAYDPWTDWQGSRLRAALMEGKVAGRQPKLHFKPGQTEMPPASGKYVDNAQIAQQILSTITEGRGVAIPDLQYEDAMLVNNPKMAGLSPWVLEVEDFGSNESMLRGFIGSMEYRDKLLVRSWGWPERAVLEAHHGTRADAKQHTDSSVLDRELIDDDLAMQFQKSVADDILVLNFGEDYRGAVEIMPAPLVDQKVEVYTEIVKAIMGDQQVAPEALADVDLEEVFDHLDIGLQEGSDINSRFRELAEEMKENRQQQQQALLHPPSGGNGPSSNGNGKPKRPVSSGRNLED